MMSKSTNNIFYTKNLDPSRLMLFRMLFGKSIFFSFLIGSLVCAPISGTANKAQRRMFLNQP